jgi:hypothetical protein
VYCTSRATYCSYIIIQNSVNYEFIIVGIFFVFCGTLFGTINVAKFDFLKTLYAEVLTNEQTTFVQSDTTQVYLMKLPSHVCCMFHPVLRPSLGVATHDHIQEDKIEI